MNVTLELEQEHIVRASNEHRSNRHRGATQVGKMRIRTEK
jgi:hypothetical protein